MRAGALFAIIIYPCLFSRVCYPSSGVHTHATEMRFALRKILRPLLTLMTFHAHGYFTSRDPPTSEDDS